MLSLACLVALVLAADPQASDSAPALSKTKLAFTTTPVADLFFFARACAAPDRAEPVPEGFTELVEALRALDAELGHFLAWGPIQACFFGCDGLDELDRAFESLPETYESVPGRSVPLRERAFVIAELLREVEPAFRAEIWPEHERSIEEARARLAKGFEPKEGECLAFHLRSLGMEDPALEIPVTLVAEAPSPGAITHRAADGSGVCFVSVRTYEGTQLFESVLHEATHALDVAMSGASALEDLRARLTAAGLGRRDAAFRDFPHTLMFVQSAESIRRVVDERHEDYGDVAGYYAKVPRAAPIVRSTWKDHLDGKLTREDALERIAAAAVEGD